MKSSKSGLELSSFCQWDGDTLVLNILGRPRANKTRIGKVIGKQLEIHVAENPVRGVGCDTTVAIGICCMGRQLPRLRQNVQIVRKLRLSCM